MLTVYSDRENIKNVDDIQIIYNEKYKDKINNKEEFNIIEIINEIKEKIQADKNHKDLLEFINDLFKYLLPLENEDLSSSKNIKLITDDIFFIKDSN